MAVTNSLTKQQPSKPKFSVVIQQDAYKNLVNNTLGDQKRAQRFIAAVSSAVAVNPALQECEAGSILSGALLGEALNLSPSPQLGQYYLVPYKKKDKDGNIESVTAQFQLGYKGYLQLAIRSGYYKKINVLAIKEGELLKFDPLEEVIEVKLIEDDEIREATPTIGYYAMFEYQNGFKKAMYWSKKKMLDHADRFSQAFSKNAVKGKNPKYNKVSFADFEAGKVNKDDMWLYSSFWYKDFDGMAYKTMLRQLISKWGIMSIELQTAFEKDETLLHEDGSYEYVDNSPSNVPEGQIVDVESPAHHEDETQGEQDDLGFFDQAGA
jgi:recombination protein RecT